MVACLSVQVPRLFNEDVIPFLKVYIALTAPERTDSQSMLQGGTN